MKINEVTEGFLGYLGAAAADAVGARQTADALRTGMGTVINDQPELFKDPKKVERVIDMLLKAQNAAGKKLTDSDVVKILRRSLPTAWNAEGNRDSIVKGFMSALAKSPVTPKPEVPGKPVQTKTAAAPADVQAAANQAADMKALRAKLQARKAQFRRR